MNPINILEHEVWRSARKRRKDIPFRGDPDETSLISRFLCEEEASVHADGRALNPVINILERYRATYTAINILEHYRTFNPTINILERYLVNGMP